MISTHITDYNFVFKGYINIFPLAQNIGLFVYTCLGEKSNLDIRIDLLYYLAQKYNNDRLYYHRV